MFVADDYFERRSELLRVYSALIKNKHYKKNPDLVRVAIAQHMVIDKEVSNESIDAWIQQHVRLLTFVCPLPVAGNFTRCLPFCFVSHFQLADYARTTGLEKRKFTRAICAVVAMAGLSNKSAIDQCQALTTELSTRRRFRSDACVRKTAVLLIQHASDPVCIEITSDSDGESEDKSNKNASKSAAAAAAASDAPSTIFSPHARKRAPRSEEVESEVEMSARESKRAKSGAAGLGPIV